MKCSEKVMKSNSTGTVAWTRQCPKKAGHSGLCRDHELLEHQHRAYIRGLSWWSRFVERMRQWMGPRREQLVLERGPEPRWVRRTLTKGHAQ